MIGYKTFKGGNLKIYFDDLKNKHKLNLVKGIVVGTIAFNAISLSACANNSQGNNLIVETNLETNNNEIDFKQIDETKDYFENVVEMDLFRTIYINCDNFPKEIKNREKEIPQTFYDKLNSFLRTKKYNSINFYNDFIMLDYSKIDLIYVDSINYENCFVYSQKGDLLFKDPTSEYIDLVLDSGTLGGTIYINCDNFTEEIKSGQEEIPSTFYNLINDSLQSGKKYIVFYGNSEMIDYSKIDYNYVEDVSYQDSIKEPIKEFIK